MLRQLRRGVLARAFSSATRVGIFMPLDVYVPQELVYLTTVTQPQNRLASDFGFEEILTSHLPAPFRNPENLSFIHGKDILATAPPKFAEVYTEAMAAVSSYRKGHPTDKPADSAAGDSPSDDPKFPRRVPAKSTKLPINVDKPVTFDPYLHSLINNYQPSTRVTSSPADLDVTSLIQRQAAVSLSRTDFYDFQEGKFSGVVCRIEGFASCRIQRILEPNSFSLEGWIKTVLNARIANCDTSLATVRRLITTNQNETNGIQMSLDTLRAKLDENHPSYILKSEDELWRRLREANCSVVEFEQIPDTYKLTSRLSEADYRQFVEKVSRTSASLRSLAAKTNFSTRNMRELPPTIERAAAAVQFNSLVAHLISKHVLRHFDVFFLANEPDLLVRAEFVAATVKRFANEYLSSWTTFDSKKEEETKAAESKTLEDLYEHMRAHQEESSSPSKKSLKDKITELLKNAKLPEPVRKAIGEELSRFGELSDHDHDYHNVKNYLELVLKIPFGRFSTDQTSLARAQQILDDSHFGMDEIKKRILQFLAVSRTKGSLVNKKILCLLGPPGVGKTSISKAIADCLGRKFVRVSLGGENDVSVIKGHRRSYVGAYPGKIVGALKMAGTENPVILLDEVDKVSQKGYKGNIQDVLLEVLDPAQNHAFTDHYLDMPVDLSKVLFLCSANVLDSSTIIPALLDRMEVVELSGYTLNEKKAIFRRHLVPKAMAKAGLDKVPVKVEIPDPVLEKLINDYAREPGVRNLEKHLVRVLEKTALNYFTKFESELSAVPRPELADTTYTISEETMREYLGPKRFSSQTVFHDKDDLIGFAFGLGYNGYGGSVLSIEVLEVPSRPGNATPVLLDIDNIVITGGKPRAPLDSPTVTPTPSGPDTPASAPSPTDSKSEGSLMVTGSLGSVMKESVEIAYSFAKHYLYKMNHDPTFLESRNLHIHFPEGASKKDGPSAGVTIATALVSAAIRRRYNPQFAMTGEVSLNGKILKVGGIKEKVLAARREGITQLILPRANAPEVDELPADVRDGLTFHFAENFDDVQALVFGPANAA